MAKMKTISEDSFREFRVRVVERAGQFIGVGWDSDGNEISRKTAGNADDAKKAIKHELLALSNDYVSIEGAINVFRKVFPEGFGSPFYDHVEGDYKSEAAAFVAEHFSEGELRKEINARRFSTIARTARHAISRTNLTSQFEAMAFSDFLKVEANHEAFAKALQDLLFGDDFNPAFKKMVRLLSKQENAAKWPIVTYFPFFAFPETHIFVKPDLLKTCAYRLGYELEYETRPSFKSYESGVGLVDMIRDGISALEPRDNIDIQTFMYVVASDGYIAAVSKQRRSWLQEQETS